MVIRNAVKAWWVQPALCALAVLVAPSVAPGTAVAGASAGTHEAGTSSTRGDVAKRWRLKHKETFESALPSEQAAWAQEDRGSRPPYSLYGLRYDNGDEWRVKYGTEYFEAALASFDTYRKSFRFGDGGWLTAELSARDAGGAPGDSFTAAQDRPSIETEVLPGAGDVARLDVPSHTGGALIRSTEPLPQEYRIEYELKTIDFGGERDGTLAYDGKLNGYDTDGCKTLHPWAQAGITLEGTDPADHCAFPSVRDLLPSPTAAYNQFHFLSIMDTLPVPQNNGWPHFHRKVMIDAFNPHPGRTTRGRVCNSDTGEYYDYDTQSTHNGVNMLFLGPQTGSTGTAANNRQMFASSCEEGTVTGPQIGAAELQPELMPKEDYTFAIERSRTGYTMEVSGNFRFVGEETYRFSRDFVDDNQIRGQIEQNVPIWHYNVTPEEYDGRFDNHVEVKGPYGTARRDGVWPGGSAYPDYFFIGDGYTNVAEGSARVDNIRLYVPKGK